MDRPLLARRRAAASRSDPDAATGVNDIHSQLNATRVSRVLRPQTVGALQAIIRATHHAGTSLSFCGGRHAMGGQQFATDVPLVDMTALNQVVEIDPERGLVTVEAGINWVSLVNHLIWTFPDERGWGIVQKQTGADTLSIGGSLAANVHGRGLTLRPMIGEVESFDLVDPSGCVVRCSRIDNPGLFALAAGGYGLFGPIVRVTLRLGRRHKVQRRVRIARVGDFPSLVEDRVRDGYEYGDLQFAIDPSSSDFLDAGVFSCYRPVDPETIIPDDRLVLTFDHWRRLLRLAHTGKSQAFSEYARHYMATDGQVYWSDTHQLSLYPEGYHAQLDAELAATAKGSEMISELYVPRPALERFMAAVRADARRHQFNIIYGTVRVIEQDDESVLAWARQRWACIVFNLHVDHTAGGIAKAAADFSRLIDRAAELGGSYYLTYHRWATADQVRTCHPRMMEFLEAKRRFDPAGMFTSDWYMHHMRLLSSGRRT